jgi:hypothetical protein
METKYPNTLVSSREDKKLVYANDVYSKYYSKSVENKIMDLDNEHHTIKNNVANNKNNIDQLTSNIVNNTNDITKIKKDIATNKTNINTNKANITANTNDINKLKEANTGINNNINTIKSDINTNTNDINTNKEAIKYIKGNIVHITDTISEQYYTNTQVDNKLGNIIENTWCTKELINCTGNDDSHKLYVGRIDIPKNITNINYFTTITIKIAKDATSSNSLKLRILDSEDNVIADSNNYIIQSDNVNKYVTWYFDPIIIPQNGIRIRFIDLNNRYDYFRVHGTMEDVGISCLGLDLQMQPMCPAIGFNVTPLVHLDLYNKFVSLNV